MKAEIINPKNPRDQIAIYWCIEDVLAVDNTITKTQARDILQALKDNHDANEGINWDIIGYAIQDFKDANGELARVL